VKIALLLILAVLSMPRLSVAQYGSKAVYRFLNIPVSAQSAALGGMPVSLPDAGPAQLHNNPAYLSASESGQFSATWSRYLAESSIGAVSGAWHIEGLGTLGGGIRYMNYGEFDRIDLAGNTQGSFTASDMAFKLALARTYTPYLRYGLGVDFIYSSYGDYTSSGIAVSGGVLLSFSEAETTVGISFVNLGTQLTTYDGIREHLPFDLRAGVTHKLEYLPLRLSLTAHSLTRWEMSVPGDEEPPDITANILRHLTLGGEFLFSRNFHFRLGYNQYQQDELKTDRTIDLAGLGFGVGITVKGVGIELSRNSYSEMGHLFKLGIQTRL